MTEIPNKVSLTIIPKLVELLSSEKLNADVQQLLLIVTTLYVIIQKTKDKDGWSKSFLTILCKGIVPFL